MSLTQTQRRSSGDEWQSNPRQRTLKIHNPEEINPPHIVPKQSEKTRARAWEALQEVEANNKEISVFLENIRQDIGPKTWSYGVERKALLLEMIHLHNDEGLSLVDAAEQAGIIGFPGDNPALPPISRARAILREAIEKFCTNNNVTNFSAVDRRMSEFEKLCPYRNYVIACTVPASEHTFEHRERNKGYCTKMSSEIAELTLEQDTLDPRAMRGRVASTVSKADYHQNALGYALKGLKDGEISMSDLKKLEYYGMRLEPAYNKRRNTHLVCLHVLTDTRIYGDFNPATGELIWKGIIDTHKKWSTFIQNYANQ